MKHCHEGHRERLLATVSRVGLKNLSDFQILEYILTLIIPRKDTNPIAHRLLDEYGSLSKVLEADYRHTMKILGMGETTAKKLATIKDICKIYVEDRCKNNVYIVNLKNLYDFVKNKFLFEDTEKFYLIGLNSSYKVTSSMEINSPSINTVSLPIRVFLDFVSKFAVERLLVLHNHPHGSCVPSSDDVSSNDLLESICSTNLIQFHDHIIYGNKEMYSMTKNTLYREDDLIVKED